MNRIDNIQFAGNFKQGKDWLLSGNPIAQLLLAIIFIFIVILIIHIIIYIFFKISK